MLFVLTSILLFHFLREGIGRKVVLVCDDLLSQNLTCSWGEVRFLKKVTKSMQWQEVNQLQDPKKIQS